MAVRMVVAAEEHTNQSLSLHHDVHQAGPNPNPVRVPRTVSSDWTAQAAGNAGSAARRQWRDRKQKQQQERKKK